MCDIVAEVFPEDAVAVGAELLGRACEFFDQHLPYESVRLGSGTSQDIELDDHPV
ncbi:hypothetical protein NHL51_05300 [Leucobacter sp. gxy201]|uniref:hypothetical protein n=1 Tax=Leucobacter sp. gxy201 TaxID=2957200 RepID=UPI003DA11AAD